MQRGEQLCEDKRRFNRNSLSFTSGLRRGSAHRGKRGGRSRKFLKPQSNQTTSKAESETQCFRWKLQPFCGTAVLQTNCAEEAPGIDADQEHHFSDSEWEPAPIEGGSVSLNAGIQIPVASKALSNLMGIYASETSDTEDEKGVLMDEARSNAVHTEQVPCESNNPSCSSLPSTSNALECKHKDDSDSPPEEAPILHSRDVDHQSEETKPTISTQKNHKPQQQHRNRIDKQVARPTQHKNISKKINMRLRKLTLLEKLLKSEIRHERNVILQCVRYIVQSNFLQHGKPKYMKLLGCIQHILNSDFFGT